MFIISPFIWIIKSFYALNLFLMGSHGWSLILLSLEITLAMLPFYYLAEKWKRDEERIQDAMNPAMESVKVAYGGQKRHYLLREVHRIYGYKSWYSLRVTMGLLIQIPLFMAAYIYLSEYPGYRDVSFGLLKNLAAQDEIAWGVNIMPFIMTAVNLVASFLYARGTKRSDKTQLVVMALLFLVLLYDRPSGLVLYWTMNNLFGLPKNLWLKKVCPPVSIVQQEESSFFRYNLKAHSNEIVVFLLAFLYAAECLWLDRNRETIKFAVMLNTAAALGASLFLLVRLFRKKESVRSLVPSALLWVFFIVVLFDWYRLTRAQSALISMNMQRNVILFLGLVLFHQGIIRLWPKRAPVHRNQALQKAFALMVGFFLISYYAFLNPLFTYVSSPADVGIPLGDFLLENLPFFLISGCLLIILSLTFSRRLKEGLNQFLLFITLNLIIYGYIIKSDFGNLDGYILSQTHFETQSPVLYLFDLLLLSLSFWGARLIVKKGMKQALAVIALVFSGLTVQAVWLGIQSEPVILETGQEAASLPANNDLVHSFSREGQNTILFITDETVGSYIETLQREKPDIIEKLTGFVWFDNTVSIGHSTIASMSSLLAGKEYTPLALNEGSGTNGKKREDIYEQYYIPQLKRGVQVALVQPHTYHEIARTGEIPVVDYGAYRRVWLNERNIVMDDRPRERGLVLSMLAVLRTSPFMLRNSIYDKGLWVFTRNNSRSLNRYNTALRDWAYLTYLPEMCNADATGDTLKYIHNELTHRPYALNNEGELVLEGLLDKENGTSYGGNSHYYSIKAFFQQFTLWTDWLKEEGLYDNTKIILASDHGIFLAHTNPRLIGGGDANFTRDDFNLANCLLMVKDFNSRGPMATDSRLMSNSDAFYLVKDDVRTYLDSLPRDRKVTFSRETGPNLYSQLDRETVEYKSWEITDSIYDPNNWTLLEP